MIQRTYSTYLLAAFSGLVGCSTAQAEPDPKTFSEESWTFIGDAIVEEHDGQQALRLGVPAEGAPAGFGMAIAKMDPFTDGIIEYDVAFAEGRNFGGVQLRMQSEGDYEDFYMRGHQSGNPDANQYMPKYNGLPAWELYYGAPYSAPITYNEGWNHVKLALASDLMDVFINDMDTPAFTTYLKRDEEAGGFAFWGLAIQSTVWFANVAIETDVSPEIVGTPAPEPEATPSTIMSWEVSSTFDRSEQDGTSDGLSFTQIDCEESGMLNLARVQGIAEGQDTAYAKVTVVSDEAQTKAFEFGFSDVATVYLNGQILFRGNDAAFTRDYRFLGTVGYWDTVYLNLEAGENELLIAVSESVSDPTGWAIQGRFEDMNGLTL